MHWLIGIAFSVILGALAWAGVAMLRGGRSEGSKSGEMMRALALRVGASILLFVCILIAWALGWIHPSGGPLGH